MNDSLCSLNASAFKEYGITHDSGLDVFMDASFALIGRFEEFSH
jgi:hypothetical protein